MVADPHLLLLWILLMLSLVTGLSFGIPAIERYFYRCGQVSSWWNRPLALGGWIALVVVLAWGISYGSINLLLALPLLLFGVPVVIIDGCCHKIPNRFNALIASVSLLVVLMSGVYVADFSQPIYAITVALLTMIMLLPTTYIRVGIGAGDIKLIPSLVALATAASWHALMYMCFALAVFLGLHLLYLFIFKKANVHTQIALAPCLISACYVALLI